MLSEASLRTIIEFFGVVLVAFMTYFLTKSHYQQNRKWELQDRHFKEAEAYLDTYSSIVEKISNSEQGIMGIFRNIDEQYAGLSDAQMYEKLKKNVEKYATLMGEIPELFWNSIELRTSISILGDKILSDLDDDLHLRIKDELGTNSSFVKRVMEMDEKEIRDFTEKELDKVSEFTIDAHALVITMKMRLKRIAQNL